MKEGTEERTEDGGEDGGEGDDGGEGMMDADREHHAGDVNAAIYMLVITVI